MEDFFNKKIAFVVRVQAVAVTDIELLPVENEFFIVGVNDHTTFLPEVIERPDVVISSEEVYFNTVIRKFAKFCQKPDETFGYHHFVFKPEVKNIPQ